MLSEMRQPVTVVGDICKRAQLKHQPAGPVVCKRLQLIETPIKVLSVAVDVRTHRTGAVCIRSPQRKIDAAG